jgi:hypothetical protein
MNSDILSKLGVVTDAATPYGVGLSVSVAANPSTTSEVQSAIFNNTSDMVYNVTSGETMSATWGLISEDDHENRA